MRQYSADLIEVTWAIVNAVPLDLKEGLAQGTFIQPTRNAPTWRSRPNGVGGIVRLISPDRSGTLAMLIDMETDHLRLLTIDVIWLRDACNSWLATNVEPAPGGADGEEISGQTG